MLHLKEKNEKANSGYKGVGNLLKSNEKWNILRENVSLPAATLTKSILQYNQSWMDKFAEIYGFQLAPHGKTTMLPDLFKMQVASPSCWGMTLASVPQVTAAFKNGIKKVLMANQLVGKCNMDIISSILESDPNFEFLCLVDSPVNVAQLGKFFQERKQSINVLLEYGIAGGRTGMRDENQEDAVLKELENWKSSITVVGVEFFEGVFSEGEKIREVIDWALSRIEKLVSKKVFTNEMILTAAGTSWFDIVAEDFNNFEKTSSVQIKKIIRSGCYLIYDKGMYGIMERRVSKLELGKKSHDCEVLSGSLKPALKVWAYVQSIPEPNLAIIGFGRRDAGNDAGFPVPNLHYRPGNEALTPIDTSAAWEIFKMMDQHAFMKIGSQDDLKIGDMLSFDIYHACTTLDKWRNVLLIDDDYNVLDVFNSDF